MIRFSVISLNWNGRKFLGRLLDKHILSLLNTNYNDFEIIFVDNGSTDGSADYVKSHYDTYQRLKIISLKRNYGFAKGNNLAANFADKSSDVLVFINTDTICQENWLRELSEVFMDPSVGVAQPLLLGLNDGMIQFCGGYADIWGRSMTIGLGGESNKFNKLLLEIARLKPSGIKVLWVYGAAIAIRKDLFFRIGGFNELFKFSHEEQTLCIPAIKMGYTALIAPRAIVYHKGGATIKHVARELTLDFIYNRFLFILVYYSFPTCVLGLGGRFLLELYSSLRHCNLTLLIRALLKLFSNTAYIAFRRKKASKLSSNSPFLIKTPLFLSRKEHVQYCLTKLLEINGLSLKARGKILNN